MTRDELEYFFGVDSHYEGRNINSVGKRLFDIYPLTEKRFITSLLLFKSKEKKLNLCLLVFFIIIVKYGEEINFDYVACVGKFHVSCR